MRMGQYRTAQLYCLFINYKGGGRCVSVRFKDCFRRQAFFFGRSSLFPGGRFGVVCGVVFIKFRRWCGIARGAFNY